MALPVDVTDPGTSQTPVTNANDQAFGSGVAVQVPAFGSTPASPGAVDVDGDLSGQTRPSQANGNQGILRSFPSSNSGDVVQGGSAKPGTGVATTSNNPSMVDVEEQPKIGLGLPQEADGDASRPGRTPTDVTQNNVAGQVYGSGSPRNVFV